MGYYIIIPKETEPRNIKQISSTFHILPLFHLLPYLLLRFIGTAQAKLIARSFYICRQRKYSHTQCRRQNIIHYNGLYISPRKITPFQKNRPKSSPPLFGLLVCQKIFHWCKLTKRYNICHNYKAINTKHQ